MPLVSVIMNCYNSDKYLREAIDSVVNQTFQDIEIIFWDNQSTDKSAEIAQSYGEILRYFRGEEFLPLGAARKKAIEKAEGKYIALLDCDDMWVPDKIEKQVAMFQGNQSLGLVYSDCYIIDGQGHKTKDTVFSHSKPLKGDIFADLMLYNPITCPTAIFTREAYERAGGINITLEYSEEYDLFLKISRVYQVDYAVEPLAMYRLHDGNWSKHLWDRGMDEYFEILEKVLPASNLTRMQQERLKSHLNRYKVLVFLRYVKRIQLVNGLKKVFVLGNKIKRIKNSLN